MATTAHSSFPGTRWNMSKQHLANVPSHARHSLPKRTVIQAIWPVPYPKGMAARRSATGLEVIHRMKTAYLTGNQPYSNLSYSYEESGRLGEWPRSR
jgi:hypothetical protein